MGNWLCRSVVAKLPSRDRLRQLIPPHLKLPTLTSARRSVPAVLMLVGVGLLVYVASQYGLMYAEQRKLEHQWTEQNQASRPHRPGPTPAADSGLTRVSIPKINLDAIVLEGVGHKQLLLGPGHMTDTPRPGEVGNSVITGHRDTFFRHIYELNKGDNIEVRRNGTLYTYEVTGKKIVKPEDLSVLKQSVDKRLTLITCYPTYYIGPAPDRLVVFAKMPDKPLTAATAAPSSASK